MLKKFFNKKIRNILHFLFYKTSVVRAERRSNYKYLQFYRGNVLCVLSWNDRCVYGWLKTKKKNTYLMSFWRQQSTWITLRVQATCDELISWRGRCIMHVVTSPCTGDGQKLVHVRSFALIAARIPLGFTYGHPKFRNKSVALTLRALPVRVM